ncbi:hypothetical protein [Chitinophaga sp. 212800010-3]|uniref:hypothetical protein n=1 Tax=unclassified Chitinophaga TaxID=2619133 RepID=UPI002DE5BA7D|nr:Serine hydrolase [Chitinophaga sp. 212800010-3]
MKLFRQLFFTLIAVMLLPQLREHSTPIQKRIAESIFASKVAAYNAAIKAPAYQTTITKFKRRPVGINDGYGHDKICPSCLELVTDQFIYVDRILKGYYANPYLSVAVPLRSWRGPPVA